MVQSLTNPTRNHEVEGSISGLIHWVKDPAFLKAAGVGCRCGSDPVLPWLWCRPSAAALIQPLAWELLYAVVLCKKKKKSSWLLKANMVVMYLGGI